MDDPFIGTWKMNAGSSQFDPNHRPSEAVMHWRLEADGGYLMEAEGINAKGERVSERPQKLVPDGQPHPVPDFPGLNTVTTRPQPKTLRAEVLREDGSVAGAGNYSVSENGRLLTATTTGFDTQLRRFEMQTVWDRQ